MRGLVALVSGACIFIGAAASGAPKEDALAKELQKFAGNWTTVSCVFNGQEVGGDNEITAYVGNHATVTRGPMLLSESFIAVDPAKKSLDEQHVKGGFEGRMFKAIYKFEGDILTICYGFDVPQRPAKFESTPKSGTALIVLKRNRRP